MELVDRVVCCVRLINLYRVCLSCLICSIVDGGEMRGVLEGTSHDVRAHGHARVWNEWLCISLSPGN